MLEFMISIAEDFFLVPLQLL